MFRRFCWQSSNVAGNLMTGAPVLFIRASDGSALLVNREKITNEKE